MRTVRTAWRVGYPAAAPTPHAQHARLHVRRQITLPAHRTARRSNALLLTTGLASATASGQSGPALCSIAKGTRAPGCGRPGISAGAKPVARRSAWLEDVGAAREACYSATCKLRGRPGRLD